SNIRGCHFGTWSAVCWTGKYQKNIYKAPTRAWKQDRNDKKKGTITQRTCQKKIGEGHSIPVERVWYSASREPSDTLPGSQLWTQTHSIYNSVLSAFQVFL
ncbi:unnamed protein product, partial [Ascophyllum nodosum]